ncbi:MAG: hydrogenase maturation protease [Thermodesulfobacteriota bacterium]|jgi:hydrogenase maturation protease
MRKDLNTVLHETLKGRIALVGIGNVDLSDDGFGVRLAESLAGAGLAHVLVTHTVPEDHLATLTRGGFDNVVFLDAVSIGAEPGSVVFLDACEIKNRFPQVSTHKLALGMLAGLIESEKTTRVWLLGAQPATLKQGTGLSEPVERTVEILKALLLDTLPHHEGIPRMPTERESVAA